MEVEHEAVVRRSRKQGEDSDGAQSKLANPLVLLVWKAEGAVD